MRNKLNNDSELDKVISKETDEMGFPVEYITDNNHPDMQNNDNLNVWLPFAAIFVFSITALFIYVFVFSDPDSFKKVELGSKIQLFTLLGSMFSMGLFITYLIIKSNRKR